MSLNITDANLNNLSELYDLEDYFSDPSNAPITDLNGTIEGSSNWSSGENELARISLDDIQDSFEDIDTYAASIKQWGSVVRILDIIVIVLFSIELVRQP